MAEGNGSSAVERAARRQCFVVSVIGKTADEKHAHKQVLKHLIQKVLTPRGYDVVRADQIADEGLITNQIIEHLLEDDLVVADLTGLNPNVFYEMAVRHAARKPIIHLITHGMTIPFDVGNMRAVPYALDDPDRLEEAQENLEEKVKAIEDCGFKAAPNPITSVRNVAILRESDEPEIRVEGELLGAINELRSEMQTLNRRVSRDEEAAQRRLRNREMMEELERRTAEVLRGNEHRLTTEVIAERLGAPPGLTVRALDRLARRKQAFSFEDGWSEIPF